MLAFARMILERAMLGVVGCTLVALLVACGSSSFAVDPRSFDQPTTISFGCFGKLELTEASEVGAVGDVIDSALPIAACRQSQDSGPSSGLAAPNYVALVLQPSSGSVAVVQYPSFELGRTIEEAFESARVVDVDPLTPGENAVPVGTLPVDLATEATGCHAIAVNAGTCDLSRIDITSVMKQTVPGNNAPTQVDRVSITAGTETLAARPQAIVARPPAGEIGVGCSSEPDELVYIAYPECNWVAVVHAGTGVATAGIRFATDGAPSITGGDETCPVQCSPDGGGATVAQTTAPRPVALEMANDGGHLYVGAQNSASITIVDLDADGLPVAVESLVLEGDIGVRSIHASGEVNMGGSSGVLGDGDVPMEFVYAVANDGTVRVARVGATKHECDTQIDPRFVHDETDIATLSCFDPNDAGGPPRRAEVISPGILIPGGAIPLNVAFAAVDTGANPIDPVSPTDMVGHFAYISASNGLTYIVNVDDDRYKDFESQTEPLAVDLSLAVAHQLRHNASEVDATDVDTTCAHPVDGSDTKGPRLSEDFELVLDEDVVALDKIRKLPSVRALACESSTGTVPISELGFAAPADTREFAYPDLASIVNQQWTMNWEGVVSKDSTISFVDGPPVRQGLISTEDGVAIVDAGRPFCAMGVQDFDIAVLVGCDPARGDEDCGLGEICFSDPTSPAGVTTGMCFLEDEQDELAAACRDLLVTQRRYSVSATFADHLTLVERRRVLRTEPQAGCEDSAQCEQLARQEQRLSTNDHPNEVNDQDLDTERSWVCEADPTRAGDIDRCVMTCEEVGDCEPGFACSEGYCVSGPLPPAACVAALQRYEVRVSDAFAVIGSVSGFLHGQIVDGGTNECIKDPSANPLLIGRLPLRADSCSGDSLTDLTPNPCAVDVDHTDAVVPFDNTTDTCFGQDVVTETRTSTAIRFSNPAMTFHLVDGFVPVDEVCIGDNASSLPPISSAYGDLELRWLITGGRRPMTVAPSPLPAFPQHIAEGPEGGLWLLDQGDRAGTSPSLGRIIRIEPTTPDDNFSVASGTIL